MREYSRTIHGKQQLIIAAFAKALEIIPRQLCDNAGFDATDILNKLRQKHTKGESNIMFSSHAFISPFLILEFFAMDNTYRSHLVWC